MTAYNSASIFGRCFSTNKNRLREVALFAGWLVLGFILLSLAGYSRNVRGGLVLAAAGLLITIGALCRSVCRKTMFCFPFSGAVRFCWSAFACWQDKMFCCCRLSGDGDGALSWRITGGVFLFILSASAIEHLRFYDGGGELPDRLAGLSVRESAAE